MSLKGGAEGSEEGTLDPPSGAVVDAPQLPIGSARYTGRVRLGQAAFALFYADAILAALNILVIPYLIGQLGAEPYGILGIVSVLAGQLGVLHFGVGTAATRLVAESVGRGGEGLALQLAGVATVGGAASLLVGVVFWTVAPSAWQAGFVLSPETLRTALVSVPAAAPWWPSPRRVPRYTGSSLHASSSCSPRVCAWRTVEAGSWRPSQSWRSEVGWPRSSGRKRSSTSLPS